MKGHLTNFLIMVSPLILFSGLIIIGFLISRIHTILFNKRIEQDMESINDDLEDIMEKTGG